MTFAIRRRPGAVAGIAIFLLAITLIFAAPDTSRGGLHSDAAQVEQELKDGLQKTADKVVGPKSKVGKVVRRVAGPKSAVGKTVDKVGSSVKSATTKEKAESRAPTADPQTTPALNGTNPHGQGGVANVKLNPSNERPQPYDPSGSTTNEIVKVGEARGEQQADGSYRGHITIAALLGQEILSVNTNPGETRTGPLDALQTALLDSICNASGRNICLSLVTADSTTTATGSTNRFSTANAQIGGEGGLTAGVAESTGTISSDGTCQTSSGTSNVADVNITGGPVADAVQSSSTTAACNDGRPPAATSDSRVIALANNGVPLPAPGCADGTPDTVTGIPVLLPIVCNRFDAGFIAGSPAVVREALAVFAVAAGTTSLLETVAGDSEALATAPPAPITPPTPPPTDPGDDDGNGGGDDGTAGTGDDDGTAGAGDDGAGETECSDGIDNDGDGRIDLDDPDCSSPSDDSESGGAGGAAGAGASGGAAECSDGIDNDGDGRTDFPNDPDCTSASDDSEGPQARSLAFTGADLLTLVLGGLMLVGSGLVLRRRVLLS